MTDPDRLCDRCHVQMVCDGTATTDTHHTTWWHCPNCHHHLRDSIQTNPPGQRELFEEPT